MDFCYFCGGRQHRHESEEERGEGWFLQRIVHQAMQKNRNYSDSPAGAERRPHTPDRDGREQCQERKAAFGGPLRPVIVSVIRE